MAMYVFVGLNGFDIRQPEPEIVVVMTQVASGDMTEADLADWLTRVLTPRYP